MYNNFAQIRNKSLVFLMPHGGFTPSGGFKVVYEYANRFAKDGYIVWIIHPASIDTQRLSLVKRIKVILRYFYWQLKSLTTKNWVHLNTNVKRKIVPSLSEKNIPRADYYVATAVATAYALLKYNISEQKKLYLIQGFENWGVSEKYVYDSYKLGFTNITISKWLFNKVKTSGAKSILIRNGFDFDYFKLQNSIIERNPRSIAMLYHNNKLKGCEYGLNALKMLRQKYPDLKVRLFGVPDRPKNIPDWIEYYKTPDRDLHNWIYNNSAIYMAPSLQEGWGLTVGEAMICGAAIVCTDVLGFHEMIENGKNGIIVPPSNPLALAQAASKLIEDNDLRVAFALEGNKRIQSFRWDDSYTKFKNLIL